MDAVWPHPVVGPTLGAMPELPEVETIRRTIEPSVVGAQITDISLPDPSIAGREGPEHLQAVIGGTVRAVLRRGKHLILLLNNNRGIALHLRMTGSLLLGEPPMKARVRAILSFSNGERLFFNDMRRLGTLRLYEDLKPLLLRVGPEPLDENFTAGSLKASLSRHRIPIKAALLDQHIVAGIGNMYADEALFKVGIHPLAPANELTSDQVVRLWQAIRDVLERAIASQGASINTYWLPNGERGTAHDAFNVAHKKGAPCPNCSTPIERIMVRRRGAYFCPSCQS
ncbi:bifunctional DNA-formamidopyrimidine glycosylase/DNA-(apurinic or apyrimidinic site) lyase [Chloroflexota bacterium]